MRMVRGLSLSALGMKRARTPSRYSALMPSASICIGTVSVRSKVPLNRSRRCTLTLLRKGNGLLAGHADDVVLGLDLKIGLVDAGDLEDRDQAIALLKDVDRRKGAGARRRSVQPIAVETGFKSALQIE